MIDKVRLRSIRCKENVYSLTKIYQSSSDNEFNRSKPPFENLFCNSKQYNFILSSVQHLLNEQNGKWKIETTKKKKFAKKVAFKGQNFHECVL